MTNFLFHMLRFPWSRGVHDPNPHPQTRATERRVQRVQTAESRAAQAMLDAGLDEAEVARRLGLTRRQFRWLVLGQGK